MCFPSVFGRLTPIGNCVTEIGGDRESVVVRLEPRSGLRVACRVIDGDDPAVEFRIERGGTDGQRQ